MDNDENSGHDPAGSVFLAGTVANAQEPERADMKQALVLIDIQNDYFRDGVMELVGAEQAAANAKRLLANARNGGMAVVHIQHLSTRPGSTFFLPGTAGAEIYRDVRPAENEKIVVKGFPNSFRDTELLEHLRKNGVTDLVIAGMMTHMCVDATTRAAKDFGFNCVVVGDACATRDLRIGDGEVKASEVQKAFLAALAYFYATAMDTDTFLEARP